MPSFAAIISSSNGLGGYTSGDTAGYLGRKTGVQIVAPLKLIGQDLGLSVTEIPHEKRDFRTWKPPSPFLESSDFTTVGRNHVLVTASFGRIIPAAVLQLFPTGQRLNVHPSLLPKYRGAAPIQHTIINKDAETGVSIVEMLKFSQGLDCGDIWGQDRMTVPDNTNFFTLRDTLAEAGGKLLVRVLQEKIEGASKSTIQDKTKIYPLAPALTADNAHVDFKSLTVNDILALYRGISHQRPITSKARNGKLLQLHSLSRPSSPVSAEIPGTSVLNPQKETLLIHCRDGTALEVGELKWEGKGLVPAKEWWNGAKSLGLVQDGRVMLIV